MSSVTLAFPAALLDGEHVLSALMLSPGGAVLARTAEKSFNVQGQREANATEVAMRRDLSWLASTQLPSLLPPALWCGR